MRAKQLRDLGEHVVAGSEPLLESDLYRSSWMFAVGALDAYFCDAYTDVLARTLRAKNEEPSVKVVALTGVLIPIEVVLDSYAIRENWKWRMAARDLMSNKNILDLKVVKSYLNKMVDGASLMDDSLILDWGSDVGSKRWFGGQLGSIKKHKALLVRLSAAEKRLPALKQAAAESLAGPAVKARDRAIAEIKGLKDKVKATKPDFTKAREAMNARFSDICDRRHECIHNCDRPKIRPQPIDPSSLTKAIEDIEWLIRRVEAWLEAGFKAHITKLGFSAVTRNKIGCS